WVNERKFVSRVAKARRHGGKIVLCKPETFMNLSGESVGPLVRFYQLPLEKILVVVDDADLPFGEIRLRPGGGSGGHHGLDSVTQHLGSRDYARLRIGIGRKNDLREITNHVLGRFNVGEKELLEKVLSRAAGQVECWLSDGLQKAMSQFNGAVSPTNEEKIK
ncbi:MAG TPA: aminoacyl-tRNA hydrolase, partial [Candidatus Binatia bacterium]|nr:aminoacyl-tRNA hydrolase [Candidatus Binatia bacterium]